MSFRSDEPPGHSKEGGIEQVDTLCNLLNRLMADLRGAFSFMLIGTLHRYLNMQEGRERVVTKPRIYPVRDAAAADVD